MTGVMSIRCAARVHGSCTMRTGGTDLHENLDPFGWVGHELDGKYRIDRVIGEGGFGVVYRAFHAGLRESIAVKCLKVPGSLAGEQRAQFEETFLEEGRILHRLSKMHAGIAQALDVGAATSPNGVWTPYLVLEWLEGRSLQEELDERRTRGSGMYTVAQALELLGPALDALAEAHEQGIAHRDLKPPNLFLAEVGGRTRIKVLDFGIAKVLGETMTLTRALEQTGASIKAFTPQYGAPEQFDATHGATGPWTDVFAFALIFVELITGRPALEGQDTIQLFVASANPLARPTPRSRGGNVSDVIDRVLARALAVKPRERFLTAGAFAAALRSAASDASRPAGVSPMPSTVFSPPSDNAMAEHAKTVGRDRTQLAASEPQAIRSSPFAPAIHPGSSTTSPQIAATAPSTVPKGTPWIAALAGLLVVVPVAVLAVGAFIWFGFLRATPNPPPIVAPPSTASVASSATPDSEPPMLRIAPGTFEMGSEQGSAAERPPHNVTLSRPFLIDRTEVTVAEYLRCVQAGMCSSPGLHGPGTTPQSLSTLGPLCNAFDPARGGHPANCVDRTQAESYCRFVSKRLPTEAEWEYAARGTSKANYPWGNAQPDCGRLAIERTDSGLCRGSKGRTEPVGSYPSNASKFGVLDMAGNVREWVADGFDERAYGRRDATDPEVRLTLTRKAVTRGGAWSSPLGEALAWKRVPLDRAVGDLSTGFRCARSAD